MASTDAATPPGSTIYKKMKDLFDQIAADLKIEAKGYNLGAFKETLYITLRNAKSTAKGQNVTTPVPGPLVETTNVKSNTTSPAPNPQVETMNMKSNTTSLASAPQVKATMSTKLKKEITETVNAKLVGELRTLRDGKFLKTFSEIPHEKWANASADEKAEMAALAGGKNTDVAAGPSAEHIAANQADAGNKIFKLLKDHISNGWGQMGNTAFFVRRTFTRDVKRFFANVGPGNSTEAFKPSHENKTAFCRWAKKILQRKSHLSYDVASLMVFITSGPAAKPDTDDRLLPDIDVDAADAVALREVLRGLAGQSTGTEGPCPPIMLQTEGEFEVALDDANDEENQSEAGANGGAIPPPPPADKNKAGANGSAIPPPPPADDNEAGANGGAIPPPPPPVDDNEAGANGGALPPPPPADENDGDGNNNDGGAKRGAKGSRAPPAPQSTARTPAPKKRGWGAMGTDETDENVAQDDPPAKRRQVTGGGGSCRTSGAWFCALAI
ncbi:hypothetical protein K438DRAFT_2001262 [Mycena galopus ATCC 62051]|nr:hypothetical protein K438DRAFT_2001262 [Mycena galopus ATCC 62051]